MTPPPSETTPSKNRFRFSRDVLFGSQDRDEAKLEYKNVWVALHDPKLLERITSMDKLALDAKGASRKLGTAAVMLGVLSLVGSSTAPVLTHYTEEHPLMLLQYPLPTLITVVSALLGMTSLIVGAFGFLHSKRKRYWLAGRWACERLRQFHFQYSVLHLDQLLKAVEEGTIEEFHEEKNKELSLKIPADIDLMWKRAQGTIGFDGEEEVWLASGERRQMGELAERVKGHQDELLKEFFSAYADFRISHQIGYAEYMLHAKKGPLSLTLGRQQEWIEVLGLISVVILLLSHFVAAFIGVYEWTEIHWIHAISIWCVAASLGLRVLEEGRGIVTHLARYSDYLFNLKNIERAYSKDMTLPERLELMCRTEELAFSELSSFLRSAEKSKYIF